MKDFPNDRNGNPLAWPESLIDEPSSWYIDDFWTAKEANRVLAYGERAKSEDEL